MVAGGSEAFRAWPSLVLGNFEMIDSLACELVEREGVRQDKVLS